MDPITADTTFSFVTGIEGWGRNADEESAPFVRLQHDSSAQALALVPLDWGSSNNYYYQARTLFGASDFRGTRITVVLDVPAAYAGSGLNVQLIAQGEGLYTDHWHGGLTAGENTIIWTIAANDVQANGVTAFALQLSTPPTNTTILDPILMKSVEIDVPPLYVAPPVVLTLTPGFDIVHEFASGVEGWIGDGVSVSQSGGALVAAPVWSAGWRVVYVVIDDIASKSDMEFIVTVTQAHLDAGVTLQPYIQQNAGSYAMADKPDPLPALVVGDNRVTWTAAQLADARRVGLRINGGDALVGANTIAIKAVGINPDPAEQPVPATTVSVSMTNGWWIRNWYSGTTSPTYDLNGVTYTPNTTSDPDDIQLGYSIAGPVNLNGAKFEIQLEVSAAYEATELSIQPTIQQQQDSFTGHFGWWITGEEEAVLTGTHCFIAPATAFDMASGDSVALRLQPGKGDDVVGTVPDLLDGSITVKKVTVTLEPHSGC